MAASILVNYPFSSSNLNNYASSDTPTCSGSSHVLTENQIIVEYKQLHYASSIVDEAEILEQVNSQNSGNVN